jgi:hypothetical protein
MPYNNIPKRFFTSHHMTPLTSIRAFCLLCVGDCEAGVRRCTDMRCPLYPYRMRQRPDTTKSSQVSLTSFKISFRNGEK